MENTFYDRNNSLVKKIFIVFFLIILSFFIVVFCVYKFKYTLHLNDVTYEIGDEVSYDIKKYINNDIKEKEDYKLSFIDLPITNGKVGKVGKFKYKVKYKRIIKTGEIIVKDTTKPVVETKKLVIGVNEELSLDEFLTKCEDYSKPCIVTYKNNKDENINKKAGNYKLDIVISDQYDNKLIKTVELDVKNNYSYETFKKSDLKIAYISPEYKDFNNNLIIKYKEAIDEEKLEDSEKYLELQDLISEDLNQYLPSRYEQEKIVDQEILTAYNEFNYIVGFAIRVKLSNGNYTYLTK